MDLFAVEYKQTAARAKALNVGPVSDYKRTRFNLIDFSSEGGFYQSVPPCRGRVLVDGYGSQARIIKSVCERPNPRYIYLRLPVLSRATDENLAKIYLARAVKTGDGKIVENVDDRHLGV